MSDLVEATLVTGATGFIGRPLCRLLVGRGRVRALVRQGLAPDGAERVVVADLSRPADIASALHGMRNVVHLAARVHTEDRRDDQSLDAYRRVNVEGTRVLMEQAGQVGVRRVVFISTIKVMGESNDHPWREDAEPRPVDPYGKSKLEAELVVRELAMRHGVEAVILRLPMVYGPGVRANALRLLQLVDRGWPLPFGLLSNRRSMASLGNVLAAIVTSLDSPSSPGETFFVSDGHDMSTPDLVRVVARALGRPARLVPVPVALLRAAGRVGDLLAPVISCPVTSQSISRLTGSLTVDITKLRNMTGFHPPETVEEGWEAAAAWYRDHHATPREDARS